MSFLDHLFMPDNAEDGGETRATSARGRGGIRNRGGRGGSGRGGGGQRQSGRESPREDVGEGGGERSRGGRGRNQGRAPNPSKKVDMRKYEKMIFTAHHNFSDIKITDAVREECMICCKENDVFGVGECRHLQCIECAIRMRVISANDKCPVCRQEMNTMCFVFASAGPVTMSLNVPSVRHADESKYKILFQNADAAARYDKYLSHVCKYCVADGERLEFPTFIALRQHMSQLHHLSYCHHCLSNLALFSRERTTMTRQELQDHIRGGDRDDCSQKGHPKCLFCEQRFFDGDDRYRHLRRDHFFCEFCESRSQASNVFFNRHAQLIAHYAAQHYVCDNDECRQSGVAFYTELDLKLHVAQEHSGAKKMNLALNVTFNDRQLGGSRGGHHSRPNAAPSAPLPQAPYGVGLVPAEPVPRSDPSQFVVVPSAQASRPSLRYARQGGFNAISPDSFPSLGPAVPQVATSSANINYSSAPPVAAASEFPRLKVNTTKPAPAVQLPQKKVVKKKETPEEAFPSLSGGGGSSNTAKQSSNWGRHTERFEVMDDDERSSMTMGPHGYESRGPAVAPSKIAVGRLPQTADSFQQVPKKGKPSRAPVLSAEEDFPTLGPLGGALGSSSNWGQKKKNEQKKRPTPAPLPEPDLWPNLGQTPSSSSSMRAQEEEEWKDVVIPLSKKAQAKKEAEERKAIMKEEKRRKAEELRRQKEEEEGSQEEEEEQSEQEEATQRRPLGLSDISMMITSVDEGGKKKEEKKKETSIPQQKQSEGNGGGKKKNKKKKENGKEVASVQESSTQQGNGYGLIGSLFNSVYSSIVGGNSETVPTSSNNQHKSTPKPGSSATQKPLGSPPGLSFEPPPGFGPPPGFEHVSVNSSS